MAFEIRRVECRRHVLGLEDILDADRQTMQLAALILGQGVEFVGLSERAGVEMQPGANVPIARFDPAQTGRHQIRRGEAAYAQGFAGLRCRQLVRLELR